MVGWLGKLGLALALVTSSAAMDAALAEERIALIITNQDYPVEVGRLGRTHEDGRLVAAALRKVGFTVTVVEDADKSAMSRAVADHIARLSKAGPTAVGFFYYSGHGANLNKYGDNYLIPTDAPVTDGAQLPFLGVKLAEIIEGISATPARANFVVVDACRNVAFTRGSKSATKGFRPERERTGVMIAYATAPGSVAVDENVYARALAAEIPKAGRPAVLMFRAVRRAVLNATRDKQFPWTRDGLIEDFYFSRAGARTKPPLSAAAQEWQLIKETKDPAVLKAFKAKHEDPVYQALANERLALLASRHPHQRHQVARTFL